VIDIESVFAGQAPDFSKDRLEHREQPDSNASIDCAVAFESLGTEPVGSLATQKFGQPSAGIAASTASSIVRHIKPVIVAPGKMFILRAYVTGVTTGAQFEPVLTVIER